MSEGDWLTISSLHVSSNVLLIIIIVVVVIPVFSLPFEHALKKAARNG